MKIRGKILFSTVLVGMLALSAGSAKAGSLENMERERSILINALLSPDMTLEERHTGVSTAKRRLVDLERMVWRDKNLVKDNTPAVRTAFDNYDLTFLVHSSTEKDRILIDHWLDQVGVTSNSIMSSRSGRR
jgi:hypothetical protein